MPSSSPRAAAPSPTRATIRTSRRKWRSTAKSLSSASPTFSSSSGGKRPRRRRRSSCPSRPPRLPSCRTTPRPTSRTPRRALGTRCRSSSPRGRGRSGSASLPSARSPSTASPSSATKTTTPSGWLASPGGGPSTSTTGSTSRGSISSSRSSPSRPSRPRCGGTLSRTALRRSRAPTRMPSWTGTRTCMGCRARARGPESATTPRRRAWGGRRRGSTATSSSTRPTWAPRGPCWSASGGSFGRASRTPTGCRRRAARPRRASCSTCSSRSASPPTRRGPLTGRRGPTRSRGGWGVTITATGR
mmetsp:Transcript_28576/g.72391  ORF Transcript_28576/g.72391 Transcript_28576/m.72391 type:complete len:302 (+) Transcript_28576:806-1711(+)